MQAEFPWSTHARDTSMQLSVREARTPSIPAHLFASGVCRAYDEPADVEEMCYEIKSQLNGQSADLALVFASAPRYEEFGTILPVIHRGLDPKVLVGCSGAGVIGAGREFETGPGLSVLATTGNSAELYPFAFTDKQACGKDATPESLVDAIGADPSKFEDGLMLVFADPLTVSTENALSMLDAAYPSVMKVGALVSGGQEYGENRMLLGDDMRHHGVVGLLMTRDFNADVVVSGSEEPIGPDLVITRSARNEIHQLGDRSPMAVLEEIFVNADPLSQLRMQRGLVVGLDTSGALDDTDYVMRNIMDMDQETGSMMVGDLVEDGQALRFHVRDSELAAQRLSQNLSDYATSLQERDTSVDALLCFNSVARGNRMFVEKEHDAKMITEQMGKVPTAGFFSNGEIASRRGYFAFGDEDEYLTRVMGYTDTLVMLRDMSIRSDSSSNRDAASMSA